MSNSSVPLAASRVDLPTLAVALAVYGGYFLLTYFYRDLPMWVAAPLGAIWLTWYSSLQHETIHDHPTPWRRMNRVIAGLPLALWLPYRLYRISHLQHHRHGGRYLTEVPHDPESFYMHPDDYLHSGAARRVLYRANCTLAGRLTIGPALALIQLWSGELGKVVAGDRRRRRLWAWQGAGVAGVLLWTTWVCHIPILAYLFLMVYPSMSLSHLRSFAEHLARLDPKHRTVAVEANWFWRLLFLNNNLHPAHHAYPRLAWHQLPGTWRQMRARLIAQGQVHAGYGQVVRAHLWRPIITVEYPD